MGLGNRFARSSAWDHCPAAGGNPRAADHHCPVAAPDRSPGRKGQARWSSRYARYQAPRRPEATPEGRPKEAQNPRLRPQEHDAHPTGWRREEGRMPLRTIQWYLKTVHQLPLSLGAIVRVIHQAAQKAQPTLAQALDCIPGQPGGPRRRDRLA